MEKIFVYARMVDELEEDLNTRILLLNRHLLTPDESFDLFRFAWENIGK